MDLDAINAAAVRIRAAHPFPRPKMLAELPEREQTAWLRRQDELLDQELTLLGNPPAGGRAWVDVQLAGGRWVGRWSDDRPTAAALSTACWFGEPIVAAGIGLRQATADEDELRARIDRGDMLALLGEGW
jgi:hypothetical protein